MRGYCQLLKNGDTSFVPMAMDRLVERWRAALHASERGGWLSASERRYLVLAESDGFL